MQRRLAWPLHKDDTQIHEPFHIKTNKQTTTKKPHIWKGFTILDDIKNTCDSWEEVKISKLTGVWKKLIRALMDN